MTSSTIAPKATVNFIHDLAIFGASMDPGDIKSIAKIVFLAEGSLPVLTARPTLARAKAHMMSVVHDLLNDLTYMDGLELHMQSVYTRAGFIMQAFAREDLAYERNGRAQILTTDEWRQVHEAVVRGSMGYVPMLRRNGTMRPAYWVVDLLEMTSRLAEASWGANERSIRASAGIAPSQHEKAIAHRYTSGMIREKNKMLLEAAPEVHSIAAAWVKSKAEFLTPTPRPAGGLDIDGKSWIRLPAAYRTAKESKEAATESIRRERNAAGATVMHGGRTMPLGRVHRDVLDCLEENRQRGRDAVRAAMAC